MLVIRNGTVADAAAVTDANLQMAWESEQLRLDAATLAAGVGAALADPGKGRYFIAEMDEAFAGQLMITWEWSDWRNGNVWWIQSVYVRPEFRRRGVFRALYGRAREEARRAGAVGLRLYVERANAAGLGTYVALGMRRTHYDVMEEMFGGAGE